MLSSNKRKTTERGINIVKALDKAYEDYGWHEQQFIAEWFMYDFITAYGSESWFGRFLCAKYDTLREYGMHCMYGSGMIAEFIYGGIPFKFPIVQIAQQYYLTLTEEDGQRLYNEFWQKVISVLE